MLLSMLARLRATFFIFLIFASVVNSTEDVIFTSSVTYCNPPETLLIQQFDVIYFATNQSVSFNISAASVQPNVNVTANLFLNVYGLNPINYTMDLCHILDGALCPLPMYNFTGADTISLPKSLGVAGRIPNIAFKIPDLEGFAQLTLTEVGTGNVKACVQATLSNGWSAHQRAVEWLTGAFAIGTLLFALWQSFSPEAQAPFLLIDLLYLYQTIASTALFNLNYPSVYRSFTLNFAWAMGFFPSQNVQDSINRMRHITGGSLPDSSGSAISLVNRKLSPYNVQITNIQTLVTRTADSALQLVRLFLAPIANRPSSPLGSLAFSTSAIQDEVQTVTPESSNILQAGIPIYVNSVNVSTANAFMTIFLSIVILSALALSVFAIIYLTLFILAKRQSPKKHNLWTELLTDYPCYVRAWLLRLGFVILLPSLIFIFYQWTLKDSWLSVSLSVLTLLGVLSFLGCPIVSTFRFAHIFHPASIYSQQRFFASHSPLYALYREPRFYFFLPTILAVVLKSVLVAFASARGDAQLIGITVVEALLLLALFCFRPSRTRKGDVCAILQATARLLCSGLLIAFLESLNVSAIKRVVVGFIVMVIFSLAVLFTFTRIIMELLSGGVRLPFSKSSSQDDLPSSYARSMEKNGTKSHESWDPEQGLGRPVNPTPDHGAPLDSGCLPSHDFSAVASPEPSNGTCTSPRDSGTMTVGSLLPRRWSFSLSPPGSPASCSTHHFSGLQTMSELSCSPHTPVTTSSHYSQQSGHLDQHSSQGHQSYR